MGADVASRFAAARDCYDRASAILGYDLLKLCAHGSEEQLRETRVSQPAIFTTNVALYQAVRTLGLTPVVSGGHSFGEYCSLTIADAMTFEQALELVNARALAMGRAADVEAGAMAAIIGFEEARVADICARASAQTGLSVEVANLNAPAQIVVSGAAAAVRAAMEIAKAEDAKRVVGLNVSGAWHSRLMQPAVETFSREVEAARLELPRFEVIGNVEAEPYREVAQIKRCLIASLRARVRWHETALGITAFRPDFIVECGALAVLSPMMRRLEQVAPDRVVQVADSAGLDKLRSLAERAATQSPSLG